MTRKFLLAPLIVASLSAFNAQADNALGGFNNLGARNNDNVNLNGLRANNINASRVDALTSARSNIQDRISDRSDARADRAETRADNRLNEVLDGDRLNNLRDATRDRIENAQDRRDDRRDDRRALARDVAILNAAGDEDSALRERLESRSLPGLENADAAALRDRLPKVTTDQNRDGDKITRTVNVDGHNGDLKLTNVVEATTADLARNDSGERSLDSKLRVNNTIEGSRDVTRGGGDSALAERRTESSFKRSSSLNLDRDGQAKARTDDSLASRSLDRTLSASTSNESSLKRSVAGTENRDGRSTSRSDDNKASFTSTSSSDRTGLQRAERSRDLDYDFDLGNRGS